MYYPNEALNKNYIVNQERKSLLIPIHIKKLTSRLSTSQNTEDVLKLFSSNLKGDEVLKRIYLNNGWSEENKMFSKTPNNMEIIKSLEKEYDFNIEDTQQEYSHTCKQIENQIDFRAEDSNDSLFAVQKPIPLTSSQSDKSLLKVDSYDFLTYSNTRNYLIEDEININKLNKQVNNSALTPSFPHDCFNSDGLSFKRNSISNLDQKASPSNYNKSSFRSYKDPVLSKDSKNLSFSTFNQGDYSPAIHPFITQNSRSTSNLPFNLYSNQVPFSSSINLSNINNDKNLMGSANLLRVDLNPSCESKISSNIRTKILTTKSVMLKRKRAKKENELKKYNKVSKASKNNRKDSTARTGGFGLKDISNRVREIVKKLKKATYKEISDIIVNEINEKDSKDEKNIRRRIYDSLNVMKAMNLFRREPSDKNIIWNGEIKNIKTEVAIPKKTKKSSKKDKKKKSNKTADDSQLNEIKYSNVFKF
jgi:hypothetical protein